MTYTSGFRIQLHLEEKEYINTNLFFYWNFGSHIDVKYFFFFWLDNSWRKEKSSFLSTMMKLFKKANRINTGIVSGRNTEAPDAV